MQTRINVELYNLKYYYYFYDDDDSLVGLLLFRDSFIRPEIPLLGLYCGSAVAAWGVDERVCRWMGAASIHPRVTLAAATAAQ